MTRFEPSAPGKTFFDVGLLRPLLLATTLAALGACADSGEIDQQASALRAVDDSRPIRCSADEECGRGQTCEKFGCATREGVCVRQAQGCPDVWEPQCGCDGQTYSNACERIAAGVDLASEGECRPRSCGPDSARCDRGEACIYKTGVCGREDGICMALPGGCPRIWAPVCGCDGKTYGNECVAHSSGVSVSYEGECTVECKQTEHCPDPRGQFCKKPSCEEAGECAPRPNACPDVYAPVCGCDGVTYENACTANQHGATVKSEGPCRCDGRTGNTCSDGDFCDHDPGTCFIRDAEGVCVEVGEYCLAVYDPVCGCDGVTYSNDCDRIQHRAQKLHDGACDRDAAETR
jgi:hypothetical protein